MSAPESMQKLPEPRSQDAFVSIRPFSTGLLTAPLSILVEGLTGEQESTSWRFFLEHAGTGTKFWFDMGLGPDLTDYPPQVQSFMHPLFSTRPAPNTPADDHATLSIPSSAVTYIIASHAHWDHMIPLGPYFDGATTTLVCGPGTLAMTGARGTHPTTPSSLYDGRIWDPAAADVPVREVDDLIAARGRGWQPLASFDRAYDFFGDGSFWLLDAPGHLPGNLAALARVRARADGGGEGADAEYRWVLLGGDCAHCRHLVEHPDAPFGTVDVGGGGGGETIHEDPVRARETIRKIAELREVDGRVRVWLGHSVELEGVEEL